mmetsp:Transcript_10771/g.33207  ORF Transcript_10771/g.33207 Transcript_10771/m.33207 type:complete len:401 (+) Transcript_10771:50-1252(+)|eukprot:scaffold46512_cov31-Tisochrysis_lutea.AAC.2
MSKPPFEDFYAVLGVEPAASKEEILRAYRKRSLSVHPDRYKGSDPEGAIEQFHKLTQAKEILEDEKARAAFDNVLRAKVAHAARQEAQEGGRRRMREDLEQREEAAKRGRQGGPTPAEEERQREAIEAAARAELQREIERLRRTGRLDPRQGSTAPEMGPPATGGVTSGAVSALQSAPAVSAAAMAAARRTFSLVVSWPPGTSQTEDSLRTILAAAAPTHGAAVLIGSTTIAVVENQALVELPVVVTEALVRSSSLHEKGLRISYSKGDSAAREAAAVLAVATAPARCGDVDLNTVGHGEQACGGATRSSVSVGLPPGWRATTSPDGRIYFYDVKTRRSQWLCPTHQSETIRGRQVANEVGAGTTSRNGMSHEEYEAATLARLKEAARSQAAALVGDGVE